MHERMCVCCRKLKSKGELIRLVKCGNECPKIDVNFKVQGRGCYICRDKSCVELARKKRVLGRAFKCALPNDIYANLYELISNCSSATALVEISSS